MKSFLIFMFYTAGALIFGSMLGYELAQPSQGKLRILAEFRCRSEALSADIAVEEMLDYQFDNKLLILSDYATSMNYADTLHKNALKKCEEL